MEDQNAKLSRDLQSMSWKLSKYQEKYQDSY